jgi:hypothetical protein
LVIGKQKEDAGISLLSRARNYPGAGTGDRFSQDNLYISSGVNQSPFN